MRSDRVFVRTVWVSQWIREKLRGHSGGGCVIFMMMKVV